MIHNTTLNSNRNTFYRTWFAPVFIATLLFFYSAGTPLMAQDHLLLSEITLQLSDAEFIEIFNPTNSTIALDNYYLGDNQEYPTLPSGIPTMVPGDFIVRFPQGASINSGEVLVIATNGGGFENTYAQKADFEIIDVDPFTTDMIVIAELSPQLSNVGEGIALFYWDGLDSIVQDVDLMNAGIPTSASEIVDKSAIAGYLPDAHTMPYQDQNGAPGDGFSTKRILLEGQNETHSGGNGITGDDETSEDISVTWDAVFTIPTPGATGLFVSSVGTVLDLRSTLNIYPNPFSHTVSISLPDPNEHYTIKMVDLSGKVVLQNENISGTTFTIEREGLPSGLYFIELYGRQIYRGKIIIEL